MVKFLTCFLLISLIILGCQKEINNVGSDDIELESFIITNYLDDAKQLYLNEINHDSTNYRRDNPELDFQSIGEILRIIQAVYNLNIPERDTVFEIYPINGFYCYELDAVTLKVNPNLPEIENLSKNIIPTGEESLDIVLNKYNFDSARTWLSYSFNPILEVYTKNEYNLIPILEEFRSISSIVSASGRTPCGDWGNIELTRNNELATIIFSFCWHFGVQECIIRRNWEFEVKNGMAEFVGSY